MKEVAQCFVQRTKVEGRLASNGCLPAFDMLWQQCSYLKKRILASIFLLFGVMKLSCMVGIFPLFFVYFASLFPSPSLSQSNLRLVPLCVPMTCNDNGVSADQYCSALGPAGPGGAIDSRGGGGAGGGWGGVWVWGLDAISLMSLYI